MHHILSRTPAHGVADPRNGIVGRGDKHQLAVLGDCLWGVIGMAVLQLICHGLCTAKASAGNVTDAMSRSLLKCQREGLRQAPGTNKANCESSRLSRWRSAVSCHFETPRTNA